MPELLHGIIPIRIGFEISFPSLRDPWNAVNVVHCRHCESLAGVTGFHHCQCGSQNEVGGDLHLYRAAVIECQLSGYWKPVGFHHVFHRDLYHDFCRGQMYQSERTMWVVMTGEHFLASS